MIRRREFITLLGGAAAAWPISVSAQQGERMRRVGVLTSTGERDPETQLRLGAFREGLQKLGWAEGRNLQIDYRWGAGSIERTRAYELVALKPDVILGAPAAAAFNPGSRGWSTKYGYQSHGLRFDVKRATENIAQFEQRINKAAREVDHVDDPHNETGWWLIKGNQTLSALGSVRSNIWTGPAADLAARSYIAVYPTYGWWNKRPNLKGYEKNSHYALVATITTPETDIYTPVANAVQLPIVVET
jgi:hypothetical protein